MMKPMLRAKDNSKRVRVRAYRTKRCMSSTQHQSVLVLVHTQNHIISSAFYTVLSSYYVQWKPARDLLARFLKASIRLISSLCIISSLKRQNEDARACVCAYYKRTISLIVLVSLFLFLFPTFFSPFPISFQVWCCGVGVFRAIDKCTHMFIVLHWQVGFLRFVNFDFIIIVFVTRCIFGHSNCCLTKFACHRIYAPSIILYYYVWQNALSNDDRTFINILYKCKINAFFSFIDSTENAMKATTKKNFNKKTHFYSQILEFFSFLSTLMSCQISVIISEIAVFVVAVVGYCLQWLTRLS